MHERERDNLRTERGRELSRRIIDCCLPKLSVSFSLFPIGPFLPSCSSARQDCRSLLFIAVLILIAPLRLSRRGLIKTNYSRAISLLSIENCTTGLNRIVFLYYPGVKYSDSTGNKKKKKSPFTHLRLSLPIILIYTLNNLL